MEDSTEPDDNPTHSSDITVPKETIVPTEETSHCEAEESNFGTFREPQKLDCSKTSEIDRSDSHDLFLGSCPEFLTPFEVPGISKVDYVKAQRYVHRVEEIFYSKTVRMPPIVRHIDSHKRSQHPVQATRNQKNFKSSSHLRGEENKECSVEEPMNFENDLFIQEPSSSNELSGNVGNGSSTQDSSNCDSQERIVVEDAGERTCNWTELRQSADTDRSTRGKLVDISELKEICSHYKLIAWIKNFKLPIIEHPSNLVILKCSCCKRKLKYKGNENFVLCSTCSNEDIPVFMEMNFYTEFLIVDEMDEELTVFLTGEEANRFFGCEPRDFLYHPKTQNRVISELKQLVSAGQRQNKYLKEALNIYIQPVPKEEEMSFRIKHIHR